VLKCEKSMAKGYPCWNKGQTKETNPILAQISEKLSGNRPWRNENWRKNLSASCMGRVPWNKGTKGVMVAWNKGLTKETSESVKRNTQHLKGRPCTWGDKVGASLKGKPNWRKGLTKDTDLRVKKSSETLKGREITWSKKILEVLRRKPNKAELLLQNILDTHFPNEWKYVGDGSLVIGGKIPDFVNINGKKQLIEMFGIYWHREQDPQLRIDSFSRFGFATVVIWENELSNPDAVVEKIRHFPSVETLHSTSLPKGMKIKSDTL
jgi:hypothetical protein